MTSNKKPLIHSFEFKAEALMLADKVGVAAATRQMSMMRSGYKGRMLADFLRKSLSNVTKVASISQRITAKYES